MSLDDIIAIPLPHVTELLAEYSVCWYLGSHSFGPERDRGTDLMAYCAGCADNVHDTYIDCSMSFAFTFERMLFNHIEKAGK